jgi:hypothetical protein
MGGRLTKRPLLTLTTLADIRGLVESFWQHLGSKSKCVLPITSSQMEVGIG